MESRGAIWVQHRDFDRALMQLHHTFKLPRLRTRRVTILTETLEDFLSDLIDKMSQRRIHPLPAKIDWRKNYEQISTYFDRHRVI